MPDGNVVIPNQKATEVFQNIAYKFESTHDLHVQFYMAWDPAPECKHAEIPKIQAINRTMPDPSCVNALNQVTAECPSFGGMLKESCIDWGW